MTTNEEGFEITRKQGAILFGSSWLLVDGVIWCISSNQPWLAAGMLGMSTILFGYAQYLTKPSPPKGPNWKYVKPIKVMTTAKPPIVTSVKQLLCDED